MQIVGLLGMYFDAAVVFVINSLIVFRFALAIMCTDTYTGKSWELSLITDFFLSTKRTESQPTPFKKIIKPMGRRALRSV